MSIPEANLRPIKFSFKNQTSDDMINKIMVATDGSDSSELAAQAAIEIAGRSGGSIAAVYVVDVARLVRLPGYASFPGIKDQILTLMQKEGRKATDRIEDLAVKAGVPCQKIVAEGNPSEELLKIADESKVDLLIMGSVGRSGLNRFLLGSVAEKVVRNSMVPVLLIR
jgi:nucleotide-binding universal stress UspA family protein